jgi:serine/threonine-protein kinase
MTQMSTVVETSADTIQALTEFGLVTPKGLEKAKTFHQTNPGRTPRELLAHLVEQRVVTKFQADTILRGGSNQLVMSNYILTDIIGSGSMGTVYKARSTKDDGWYAIKTVPRKNVVNLKIIAEKVEALKDIRHPRVSAMISIGAKDDRIYMVWPFLDGGEKLDEMVKRQGRLQFRQAAQIALQIASGLQAYHTHTLFHGLLKPNDIVIGQDRRVRILDFGVGFLLTCERGKSMLSTTTNGKAMAKGLDCASPESIIDSLARTIYGDQYSLGCILYYCLAGQFPFNDANPVKKMLAHQTEPPRPLSHFVDEMPAKLQEIVDRLLAKQPEERYANTDDLVADLQAITSGSVRLPANPSIGSGSTSGSNTAVPTIRSEPKREVEAPAPRTTPKSGVVPAINHPTPVAAPRTVSRQETPAPHSRVTVREPEAVAPPTSPKSSPKVRIPEPKLVAQDDQVEEGEVEGAVADQPRKRRGLNNVIVFTIAILAGVAATVGYYLLK